MSWSVNYEDEISYRILMDAAKFSEFFIRIYDTYLNEKNLIWYHIYNVLLGYYRAYLKTYLLNNYRYNISKSYLGDTSYSTRL